MTGVLRHYATVLMATPPKPAASPVESRERLSILRGANFRNNASAVLGPSAFDARKAYLVSAFKGGAFLKDPENRGKPPANPMTDPAAMEGMMGMMKGNMAMMIPQTVIMGWINAVFAGFVVLKLPFPLTVRFKSMLQSGVMTRDLDVRWVSSLSWYFLCLFGLNPIFIFILGNDNGKTRMCMLGMLMLTICPAASQMSQQMAQMNPSAAANPFGPGQDPDKLFASEAENLEVMEHYCILDGIEKRLLAHS